jgi:hypothetical protein
MGADGADEYTALPPFLIEDIELSMPLDNEGNFDMSVQAEVAKKHGFVDEVKTKAVEYQQQINTLNVVFGKDFAYREVSILDKSIFAMERGKRITKKVIDSHKGAVPVYSSSKDENSVLGFIAKEYLQENNFILYSVPSVLFNIDGSVGYCFIRSDETYSFIDVVAAIQPLIEEIDLSFLLYSLREALLRTGANYQSKLYFNKIKDYNVSLRIPVLENGEFDLAAQKEIAEKYQRIEQINKSISAELDKIENMAIDLE